MDEYLNALSIDLNQKYQESWDLKTLYFGGGTPSRLGASGIFRAIDLVGNRSALSQETEITIEVNPDDVTVESARSWVAAGVNRISLGMQSFNEDVLRWMHRTHSSEQSRAAVNILHEAGISNISLDLIFAIPAALQRDWKSDVEAAISLQPTHISLYGLTAEPHTPLGKWVARGDVAEATEDTYEADFLFAHERLTAEGFEHYEVSNYGKPGYHSRHNRSYWSGVQYVGLGPSSHGFDGESRYWNIRNYSDWVSALEKGDSSIEGNELLDNENRNAERVYLGLRTSSGLLATDHEIEIAQPWIKEGWINLNERTLVLTATGWLRLDALASALTGRSSD